MGNYFSSKNIKNDSNREINNEVSIKSSRHSHKRRHSSLFLNESDIDSTDSDSDDQMSDDSDDNDNTNQMSPTSLTKTNKITSKTANKQRRMNKQLNTPSKQKMKSTSAYIYQTLFLKGESSDLILKALDTEWHLHKIYLCQSRYFKTMFNSDKCKWLESNKSYIEMTIPDSNITEKGLFIAFGSFYTEDVEILPIEVISVLACASLLTLDGLLKQCANVMLENINYETIFSYYDAANLYGIKNVSEKCIHWLGLNLMTNNEIKLNELSQPLFERILSLKSFFIIQVETDLYTLCKKWLYYQFHSSASLLSSIVTSDIATTTTTSTNSPFNLINESSSNNTKKQKPFINDSKTLQKLFNEFFKQYLNNSSNNCDSLPTIK
jgi:hypothetical protein